MNDTIGWVVVAVIWLSIIGLCGFVAWLDSERRRLK